MTDVAVVPSADLLRLRGLHTATGPAVELRSPITGEVIGELPTSTPADVEVGAQLAHRAQGCVGRSAPWRAGSAVARFP
jgi:acyl-CoA reductase-like NAD-dependent aldehyde dehydrogenase